MTDEEAIALYDSTEQEEACFDYLKAAVQSDRSISLSLTGDPASHEAEPMMLATLLAAEVVFLNTHWWRKDWPDDARNTVALCVGCNDVFAWASSDAEVLRYDEIEDLYDHWLRDPLWGPAVWCIKKRKQMPQAPVHHSISASGLWDLEKILTPEVTVAPEASVDGSAASKDRQE